MLRPRRRRLHDAALPRRDPARLHAGDRRADRQLARVRAAGRAVATRGGHLVRVRRRPARSCPTFRLRPTTSSSATCTTPRRCRRACRTSRSPPRWPGSAARGIYAVNVADLAPLAFSRGQAATLRTAFDDVCLLVRPELLRGRRFGNVVLRRRRPRTGCLSPGWPRSSGGTASRPRSSAAPDSDLLTAGGPRGAALGCPSARRMRCVPRVGFEPTLSEV